MTSRRDWLRAQWMEDDKADSLGRILSENRFESAAPDALNVEPREPAPTRRSLRDQYRMLDEIERRVPFQAGFTPARSDQGYEQAVARVPTRLAIEEAVASLPAGVSKKKDKNAAHKAISFAIDPLRPSEGPVERLIAKIPGADRPSRSLGAPLEAIASLLPAEPDEVLLGSGRRRDPLKVSPAKAAGLAAEVFAPTGLDAATFGLTKALPFGVGAGMIRFGKSAKKLAETGRVLADELKVARRTEDAVLPIEHLIHTAESAKVAQPATEAKKLMGLADPIKRREVKEVVATNDLDRLGQIEDMELLDNFMDQAPKAKHEKAPILTKRVELPPMKPENFIDRSVKLNKVIDEGVLRADEVIRHAATVPSQDRNRDALIRLANGLVESHRQGERLVGAATTEIDQIAKMLGTLKGKNRDEAALRMARYIQDPEYRLIGTGSPILDGLAEQVRGTLSREFREARKAKPDLGHIEDYFPQTKNDDVEKAIELYTNRRTDDALTTLERMYTRNGVEYPGNEKMLKWLNQKNVASTQKKGIRSFAESIDLEREMNFPGFWGDARDPQFTADKFLKALEEHTIDSGKRIADAQVFGPDAENFKTLLNSVDDRSLQEFIEVYRSRLLNQSSALEHEKSIVVGMMRNAQILAKLGRSGVTQNIVQPLITTLPYSVNTLGFRKGIKAFGKGVAEAWGDGAEAKQLMAQRIGAVNAQVLKDLTALAEDVPLGGTASRFLDATLMSKSELKNNLASYNIGKYIGPELADLYWKNPKKRADVTRRVKSIFDDQPQLARDFLQSAGLGGAAALSPHLVEEMGYQAAVKTQFRFGAKHLPLFWLTPSGKLLTQFKSFSYSNARFIEKEILAPAKKGNAAPLLALIGSGMLSGAYTRAARKAIRGERVFEGVGNIEETSSEKKTEDKGLRDVMGDWLGEAGEEMANDIATGISLGVMADLASAGERGGQKGLLEFAAGPSVTSISRIGGAAFGKKPLEGVGKAILREYTPSPFGIAKTIEDRASGFKTPGLSRTSRRAALIEEWLNK